MSTSRAVYLCVKDLIETRAPSIKTVRLWNNQIAQDNREEAIAYPAAFIEFSSISWTGRTKQTQEGLYSVSIHVVVEELVTDPVDFFCIVQEVYLAIQGQQGFQRTEEQQDTDHDMLLDWIITFVSQFQDGTADPDAGKQTTTITDATITTDFDIDQDVIRTGDGDFTI